MTKAHIHRFTVKCDNGEVCQLAENAGEECGVDAHYDFGLSWSCSRLQGHAGSHVAATFDEMTGEPEEILWVWTQDVQGAP